MHWSPLKTRRRRVTRDFVGSVHPATGMRLLLVNVVHPSGFGETLEDHGTSRLEVEPLADAQLSHCGRHRDTPRTRACAETSRELHGCAEQVVMLAHRLSCADPDANIQRCVRT